MIKIIRLLILGIIITLTPISKSYSTGIPVFDASNLANTLLTAQRSLQQIDNQLKMLEGLGFDASGQILQTISEAQTILDQVEGIAYTIDEFEDQFEAAYPSDMDGMTFDEIITLKDNLLVQTKNAQRHAMQLQANVAKSIPDTKATVGNIVNQSNSAVGTTSAMQANTQMLATMSAQNAQTQALLISQSRAINAQILEENSQRVAAKKQRKEMLGTLGGSVGISDNGDKILNPSNN